MGTVTRFDELAKGFLAKATPAAPNKQQTDLVLIHQNSGFVNARHIYKKYENLEKQMKEMGNMGYVEPKC